MVDLNIVGVGLLAVWLTGLVMRLWLAVLLFAPGFEQAGPSFYTRVSHGSAAGWLGLLSCPQAVTSSSPEIPALNRDTGSEADQPDHGSHAKNTARMPKASRGVSPAAVLATQLARAHTRQAGDFDRASLHQGIFPVSHAPDVPGCRRDDMDKCPVSVMPLAFVRYEKCKNHGLLDVM